MNKELEESIKLVPPLSGCYIYYDKAGEIIYIGKAKNLKKRVSSYFHKKHDSVKVAVLVSKIEKMEYIITDSEVEALILEAHLIKKHKPKYNILLKDDKKYPYFLITQEDYPRITVVRKKNLNPDKGKFYGPYTNSRAMYSTLDFLKKIFPLKQCKTPKFSNRPCLYYHIGKCLAPCQGKVTPEEYKQLIAQVELFLSGKQTELINKIKSQMEEYAKSEQYEKAARMRDSYIDLQRTLEHQKVVYENKRLNEDIIAALYQDGIFAVTVMLIREGRLIDKKDFTYFVENEDKDEFFKTFFREYYSTLMPEFPDRIVSADLESAGEKKLYEEWLTHISHKKIKIGYGRAKQGKELYKLAQKNVQNLYETARIKKLSAIKNDFNEVGKYLQDTLNLKNFPNRIECYDISHIQGTNTVASMVVFVNGMSKKSDYRKFKLKTTEGKPDDFLSMKEVLTRRLSKLGEKKWERPDLIIIDGGKGQLSSVMKVVSGMNITGIDFVSLAKREEEVFLPNQSESIRIPMDSNAMFLIQRIRDEAHRFAITYHRDLRSKSMKTKPAK